MGKEGRAGEGGSVGGIKPFRKNSKTLKGASENTVVTAYPDPPVTVAAFKASSSSPPLPPAPASLLFTPGGVQPDSVQTAPVTPAAITGDAITDQLNLLYQQVLGRNADSSGLATYGAMLNGGTSLAEIRQIIANSPEEQGLLNALYRQIFCTHIDQSGDATYPAQT